MPNGIKKIRTSCIEAVSLRLEDRAGLDTFIDFLLQLVTCNQGQDVTDHVGRRDILTCRNSGNPSKTFS